MELIDKNKIDFTTIEPYEYSSEEMKVVFKEDIEGIPTVKVIPIDRIKQAREEIENSATYDGYIDMVDVLEILDKLKESMEGLTMEQAKMLRQWAEGLWVLLDQDDYNNIAKIFKNAVGREVEYQEGQNEN